MHWFGQPHSVHVYSVTSLLSSYSKDSDSRCNPHNQPCHPNTKSRRPLNVCTKLPSRDRLVRVSSPAFNFNLPVPNTRLQQTGTQQQLRTAVRHRRRCPRPRSVLHAHAKMHSTRRNHHSHRSTRAKTWPADGGPLRVKVRWALQQTESKSNLPRQHCALCDLLTDQTLPSYPWTKEEPQSSWTRHTGCSLPPLSVPFPFPSFLTEGQSWLPSTDNVEFAQINPDTFTGLATSCQSCNYSLSLHTPYLSTKASDQKDGTSSPSLPLGQPSKHSHGPLQIQGQSGSGDMQQDLDQDPNTSWPVKFPVEGSDWLSTHTTQLMELDETIWPEMPSLLMAKANINAQPEASEIHLVPRLSAADDSKDSQPSSQWNSDTTHSSPRS